MLSPFIPPFFHLWHLPVTFLAGLVGEGYATAIGSGGVLIQFALAALGLPLANVVATDLAGCMGADAGILSVLMAPRKIWNKRKLFLQLTIPITLGGITGTFFLIHVPAKTLTYILIIGLSLLLLHLLVGKQKTLQSLDELHIGRRQYTLLFIVLFVLGVYGNISGVGSGTFMKLVFISMLRISVIESMGIGTLVTLPAALFSLGATATAGLILWPYCLTLWISTFIGARYMVGVVRKVPNSWLRGLLMGVVSLYLIWLLVSLL